MNKLVIGLAVAAFLIATYFYIDYRIDGGKADAYHYTLEKVYETKDKLTADSDKNLNDKIDKRVKTEVQAVIVEALKPGLENDKAFQSQLDSMKLAFANVTKGGLATAPNTAPDDSSSASVPDPKGKGNGTGTPASKKRKLPSGPKIGLHDATVFIKGLSDVDNSVVTIASKAKKMKTNLKDGVEYDEVDIRGNAFADDIPALKNAASAYN